MLKSVGSACVGHTYVYPTSLTVARYRTLPTIMEISRIIFVKT